MWMAKRKSGHHGSRYCHEVNIQVVPCVISVGSREIGYELVVDVDLGDPIGAMVMAGQWPLSPALMWLLASLKAGDSVLDLGAHFGTFAIPAAILGANVVAVEGSPRNAAVLRLACEQNNLGRVQVLESVVDKGIGEVEFVDLGPYGTISTPDIGSETGYPTIRRRTMAMDDLPGKPFTWAKIDVEGKERDILLGGRKVLADLRGMVVESNGYALHSHGTSPRMLIDVIEESGLTVYEVTEGELRRVGHPVVQAETVVDYVAVRGDLHVPAGWVEHPERSSAEIVSALKIEAAHSVPEHRDYALRTIGDLPRSLAKRYRRA